MQRMLFLIDMIAVVGFLVLFGSVVVWLCRKFLNRKVK